MSGPRKIRQATRLAPLVIAGLSAGCIASNVVAPEQRMVLEPLAEQVFVSDPKLVLDGLYESVDIRGDAAVSLRKIYYVFDANGTYTAAALADDGGRSAFQTLGGTWHTDAGGLVLDDQDPVALEASGDHIRLSTPSGTVVLAHRSLL